MLINFRPPILREGESGGGGPPAAPPPPAPAPPPADPLPGPVPYERFKEVNDQLKTLQGKLTKIEAAQKAADDKLAGEKGEWEKLAKQHEAELTPVQQENLRLRVALKKRLPEDLIDRLRGSTEEELTADADALMKFFKPAEGPGVPPPGRGSTPPVTDFSKMTPAEIRTKTKGKPLSELA